MTNFAEAATDKARLEVIKHKLMTDDAWLYRGLLAIYARQTEDEKNSETTTHDNGKGFTGSDAYMFTEYAKFLKKTGFLTAKQRAWLRSPSRGSSVDRARIEKYARQLLKVAKEKGK